MTINYLDIAKELPFKKNDIVVIASGIRKIIQHQKSIGENFDAQAFINSFKKRLPEGSLLFHAFTDSLISGDTFDYKKSKPNTGALSVVAWQDADFIRTQDPFHSFMVWGAGADELKKMDDISTFGNNSVFAWLHQNKAKMLLINTPKINGFTFRHYCEEKLKVKYRKYVKHKINYIDKNGEKSARERLFYTRKNGYHNYYDDLDFYLKENGIAKKYLFNNISFTIIDCEQAFDLIKLNLYPQGNLYLCKFSYKTWFKDILRKFYRTVNPKKPIVL